ncbi:MAG: 50S ribosomal protein L19e [Thermoplasmatota archaeon]
MSDLRNQKRVAAQLLKCGGTRVWIDPLHGDEVAEAVTREDIRGLIEKGYISKSQKKGVSHGRAQHTRLQKASGRQRGPGSRKGAKGARTPKKQRWMGLIRAQRNVLRELRDGSKITPTEYRHYYLQTKGGRFRSKASLLFHLKTEGILKEAA